MGLSARLKEALSQAGELEEGAFVELADPAMPRSPAFANDLTEAQLNLVRSKKSRLQAQEAAEAAAAQAAAEAAEVAAAEKKAAEHAKLEHAKKQKDQVLRSQKEDQKLDVLEDPSCKQPVATKPPEKDGSGDMLLWKGKKKKGSKKGTIRNVIPAAEEGSESSQARRKARKPHSALPGPGSAQNPAENNPQMAYARRMVRLAEVFEAFDSNLSGNFDTAVLTQLGSALASSSVSVVWSEAQHADLVKEVRAEANVEHAKYWLDEDTYSITEVRIKVRVGGKKG